MLRKLLTNIQQYMSRKFYNKLKQFHFKVFYEMGEKFLVQRKHTLSFVWLKAEVNFHLVQVC